MKILHTVESYLPAQNGMQKVVQELSERLAAKGHEVIVATSGKGDETINGVNVLRFDCAGNYATGMTGDLPRYKWLITEEDYDIIVNFAAQQWATDYVMPYLSWIETPKVFVPTGFSGLYNQQYAEYFSKMPRWLKQYDANVFHSTGYRDITFARMHHVPESKIVTIPNGASEKEFEAPYNANIRQAFDIPENHLLILLVGSHTGQKGHAEAIEIFRKADISPATLAIIGEPVGVRCFMRCLFHDFISMPDKRVLVCPSTRQDTIALFHAADLFLFPSNIEAAPLVLYEAMASRTPFLATNVGNAKEIADMHWCGSSILPTIIDASGYSHADISGSIKCLEYLASNPLLRESMKINGYAAWKANYTWERIAEQYEQLYKKLVGEQA